MPVPAGRDERPMPRHGTIIGHSSARNGRQCAARFVHQKISRRKVPVVAVAAGKGGVAGAMRDLGQPERQRAHPRHGRKGRRMAAAAARAGSRGPAIRAPSSSRPVGRCDLGAVAGGAGLAQATKNSVDDRRDRDRPRSAGRPRPAPPTPPNPGSPRYRRACRRSDRRSRHDVPSAEPGSSTLSSDSQAMASLPLASRSRNKLSTAMSASLTGDAVGPLVQVFSGVPNIDVRQHARFADTRLRAAARKSAPVLRPQ